MQGTTWCSPHLQLLKVVKYDSPFFFLKFSTRHRPNEKSNCSSLNTLRAVYGNSFEAEGCLKSCLIIPNCFFPDSQQINNTCSSFLLLVEHIQAFTVEFCFLQCCVVKTLQLQFEGLLGEQLNLSILWLQLTSLRSP